MHYCRNLIFSCESLAGFQIVITVGKRVGDSALDHMWDESFPTGAGTSHHSRLLVKMGCWPDSRFTLIRISR